MMTFKNVLAVCGASALVLTLATSGQALGTGANTNYLTFSGPVALPGVELTAGTYIFERALPDSSLNLVRVLSPDRGHVYLTAFTRIVKRPDDLRPGQVASLGESARGVPPPVRVWYPVGGSIAHEFIYR